MKDHSWIRRLNAQLPGWYVYTSTTGKKWRAVPAPAGTVLAGALDMPKHIYCDTPAALRAAARLRYGWDDYCGSCGVLARTCGHRQPERRDLSS